MYMEPSCEGFGWVSPFDFWNSWHLGIWRIWHLAATIRSLEPHPTWSILMLVPAWPVWITARATWTWGWDGVWWVLERRTFDRGHWLYFELMVDMQKSQPLGTVGLADRPTWKPLPNCFWYFLCAFRAYMTAPSTLKGGAEPISTAHLRPEDFPRVFLINVPLQAETPAWSSMLQNAVTISDHQWPVLLPGVPLLVGGLLGCQPQNMMSSRNAALIFRPPLKTASLFGMRNCQKNKSEKQWKTYCIILYLHARFYSGRACCQPRLPFCRGQGPARSCPSFYGFVSKWRLRVYTPHWHFCVESDDQQFEFRVHGIQHPHFETTPYILWLFNIAMENGPFIDGVPIKNGDFPWLC